MTPFNTRTLLAAFLPVLAACGSLPSELETVCTAEAWPSVLAEVRDQNGIPAARGATLVIRDGAFVDSSRAGDAWDGLRLGAGNLRPGTYSVEVTKPGYRDAVIPRVVVPAGPCGAQRQVVVQVRLELLPGAPPVRSVTVVPTSVHLGLPSLSLRMEAWVDAAPGTNPRVTWTSSDTTVATVSAEGVVVAQCRAQAGTARITATSVADPARQGTATVSVAPPPANTAGISPESLRRAVEDCLARLRG